MGQPASTKACRVDILACCLNYERYICELFGERYSLGTAAAFTLQFRDLTAVHVKKESVARLPSQVAKFIQKFEADLSDEEVNSTHYQCRLLFKPVSANREGQADAIIEFVRFDSEVAKEGNEDHQQVVLKDRERNKYRPTTIVKKMNEEGCPRFNIQHHTKLWQKLDAKNPGKGYGKEIEKQWYWYDRWLEEVRGTLSFLRRKIRSCVIPQGLLDPEYVPPCAWLIVTLYTLCPWSRSWGQP